MKNVHVPDGPIGGICGLNLGGDGDVFVPIVIHLTNEYSWLDTGSFTVVIVDQTRLITINYLLMN